MHCAARENPPACSGRSSGEAPRAAPSPSAVDALILRCAGAGVAGRPPGGLSSVRRRERRPAFGVLLDHRRGRVAGSLRVRPEGTVPRRRLWFAGRPRPAPRRIELRREGERGHDVDMIAGGHHSSISSPSRPVRRGAGPAHSSGTPMAGRHPPAGSSPRWNGGGERRRRSPRWRLQIGPSRFKF